MRMTLWELVTLQMLEVCLRLAEFTNESILWLLGEE